MRRYLDRKKAKKRAFRQCMLEIGVLNGVPVLMFDGKVVNNTYHVELRHDVYSQYRGRVSVESEFVHTRC